MGEGSLSYFFKRSSFLYDLKSAWRLGPYDTMRFYSPLATQFAAVALWLRQFQPDQSPFVVVGFDTASGNKLNDHHRYYARFYRKAGKLLREPFLAQR
jgi:hypothetical protein